MERAIVNQFGVRTYDLNPNNYLLSLLDEACNRENISQREMDDIQTQLMELLRDIIIKYTGGGSTSVKVETAQNLLMSLLYCIDACCMSFGSPDQCLNQLKSTRLQVIYEQGLHLVQSRVQAAKTLLDDVKSNRIQTSLVAYNSTIDHALPDFFAQYDVRFNAHDTMADIDYPLASDDLDMKGIFYIQQYLEKLKMENQFCMAFTGQEIDRLLENYGRVYRIHYPEFLLNIFEITLTNAVFSVMLGNSAGKLTITASACDALRQKLAKLDAREIPLALNQAAARLIEELEITGPGLKDYIHQYEQEIAARTINALKLDSLNKLVITDSVPEARPEITLTQGAAMDNESFRRLVERVAACADPSQKAEIIISNVKALGDFLDILDSDCLFAEEYLSLYALLGDMELAILAKIIFSDELRDGAVSFPAKIFDAPEPDAEWARQLLGFLSNIKAARLQNIARLVNTPTEYTGII
jgi:hypothetical protein